MLTNTARTESFHEKLCLRIWEFELEDITQSFTCCHCCGPCKKHLVMVWVVSSIFFGGGIENLFLWISYMLPNSGRVTMNYAAILFCRFRIFFFFALMCTWIWILKKIKKYIVPHCFCSSAAEKESHQSVECMIWAGGQYMWERGGVGRWRWRARMAALCSPIKLTERWCTVLHLDMYPQEYLSVRFIPGGEKKGTHVHFKVVKVRRYW